MVISKDSKVYKEIDDAFHTLKRLLNYVFLEKNISMFSKYYDKHFELKKYIFQQSGRSEKEFSEKILTLTELEADSLLNDLKLLCSSLQSLYEAEAKSLLDQLEKIKDEINMFIKIKFDEVRADNYHEFSSFLFEKCHEHRNLFTAYSKLPYSIHKQSASHVTNPELVVIETFTKLNRKSTFRESAIKFFSEKQKSFFAESGINVDVMIDNAPVVIFRNGRELKKLSMFEVKAGENYYFIAPAFCFYMVLKQNIEPVDVQSLGNFKDENFEILFALLDDNASDKLTLKEIVETAKNLA